MKTILRGIAREELWVINSQSRKRVSGKNNIHLYQICESNVEAVQRVCSSEATFRYFFGTKEKKSILGKK